MGCLESLTRETYVLHAGAVPQSSGQLIYVNAIGDPLSFSTSSMGHLPHGPVHDVRRPAFLRWRVDSSRPSWLFALSPALSMGLDVADTVRSYADILSYLGDVMLYHHSIDTLAPVVSRDQRFASPLVAPRRRPRHWEVTRPTARAPD